MCNRLWLADQPIDIDDDQIERDLDEPAAVWAGAEAAYERVDVCTTSMPIPAHVVDRATDAVAGDRRYPTWRVTRAVDLGSRAEPDDRGRQRRRRTLMYAVRCRC